MSIRTNIEAVMSDIANGVPGVGNQVRAKALAAIMAGQGTGAWENYMEMFSQSPAQLARLLPSDSTEGDPAMDQARTYLVGNGTCGSDTTGTRLIEGVWDILDEDLP